MSTSGEEARLRAVKALCEELWDSYTYVRDIDQFEVAEDWRSHVEAFLRGEAWQDDCDGYSMTAVDAAVIRGIAMPTEVALHTCLVDRSSSQPYDHCTGSIDIGGITYMFDCISRDNLLPMVDLPYKWYSHKRFHGGSWRMTEVTG